MLESGMSDPTLKLKRRYENENFFDHHWCWSFADAFYLLPFRSFSGRYHDPFRIFWGIVGSRISHMGPYRESFR